MKNNSIKNQLNLLWAKIISKISEFSEKNTKIQKDKIIDALKIIDNMLGMVMIYNKKKFLD